jgi:hypothetical protein
MSKYESLWLHPQSNKGQTLQHSLADSRNIAGLDIDQALLKAFYASHRLKIPQRQEFCTTESLGYFCHHIKK